MFTKEQLQFIKDNHNDKVVETINHEIDCALTYESDIKRLTFEHANVMDLLNGKFTINDLWEIMFEECYFDLENFDEIAEMVYNDLTQEEKNEIDNLF